MTVVRQHEDHEDLCCHSFKEIQFVLTYQTILVLVSLCYCDFIGPVSNTRNTSDFNRSSSEVKSAELESSALLPSSSASFSKIELKSSIMGALKNIACLSPTKINISHGH